MAAEFLQVAASDAVMAFVEAKLLGKSDMDAGTEARTKLTAELSQALGLPDELEKWKALAMPLADLVADGSGTELSLLAPSAEHVARAGDWKWTLKSDASMKLVADVLDSDQLATLGVPPREGHQLVRYAVNGELGAAATGGTSLGIWRLKAGAHASASAGLEWYIAAASQRRLGEALVQAVPFMLPPMSLADQLERAGDFEYWGSSVDLTGDLSTSFTAAASVAGAGWTWGFDGQQAKLGLSLGVSGSATFKVGGKFRLRCIVREAGLEASGSKRFGVEVTLERLKTDATSLTLSLSAGLDASALAQSADRYLLSHLPDPSRVDASLTLITNPGTALGERLRGVLETTLADPSLKELVLVAAGFGDPKALAKSLAERAAGPLMDEIDKLGGALDPQEEELSALVDRWINRTFGDVPISDDQRSVLGSVAATEIATAKKLVNDALDKLSKELEDQSLQAAAELLRPFATLGEKIHDQLAGVATQISTSQAAQAVKKGLAEYSRLRSEVLTVLGDAQRAKIALTLAGSLDVSHSNQAFFCGTFVTTADLAPAERLFQALWSGRLDSLVSLVAEAKASGALVGEPEGWLMRSSKRVSSLSLTINLLGTQITNRVTKTSELKLQADLVGNVLASGKGSAQHDVQNYWTERHANLSLTALRRDDGPNPALEFGLNGAYSAKGSDITPDMFNAMQRSLVRVAGGGGTLDIRNLLNGPDGHSMADKEFRRNVAFLLPMSLQADEFRAFLEASSAQLQGGVVVFGARAMDSEYEGQWDLPPSLFLKDLAKALKGSFADETAHLVAYLLRFPTRWRASPSQMNGKVYEDLGLDATDMGSGSLLGSPLHRQLGKLFRLAMMVRGIVDLQSQCRVLRDALLGATLANLEQVQAAASKPLKGIADTLGLFSVASSTLIGNDEMVSWPFATFAATLAQASGRHVPPGFVACAVLPGQENRPVPLVEA